MCLNFYLYLVQYADPGQRHENFRRFKKFNIHPFMTLHRFVIEREFATQSAASAVPGFESGISNNDPEMFHSVSQNNWYLCPKN